MALSILVVGAHSGFRLRVNSLLNQSGYADVLALPSAWQLWDHFAETDDMRSKIDLIVVNADDEGAQVCQEVNSDSRLQGIPVLAASEKRDVKRMRLALALGATDFVSYSQDSEEFVARVRLLLKMKYENDLIRNRESSLLEVAQQLEEANQELHKLSSLDGLTGITNRRAFDQLLKSEFKRMVREKHPLSVVMVDIDFFKPYNDNYGHQAGDECLRKVARAIHNTVRRGGDVVARHGGEEFAVLLPRTDADGARRVAEMVLENVAELKIPHEYSSVCAYVTVSAGTATAVAEIGMSEEQLVALADEALYQAKRTGRNRVCTKAELGQGRVKTSPLPDTAGELNWIREKLSSLEELVRSMAEAKNQPSRELAPLLSSEEIAALMEPPQSVRAAEDVDRYESPLPAAGGDKEETASLQPAALEGLSSAMVWQAGPDGQFTFFNDAWLRFTGETLAKCCRTKWVDRVHPQDRRKWLDVYEAAFRERQEFSVTYRLRRHDGDYRWIMDRGFPVLYADGSFGGFIGAAFDLVDCREEQHNWRTLFQLVETPIAVVGLDGTIRKINPYFCGLLNNEAGELIGQPISAIFAQDERDRIEEEFTVPNSGPRFFEARLSANVSEPWYRWQVISTGTDAWLAIGFDQNKLKDVTEKLQKRTRALENLIQMDK